MISSDLDHSDFDSGIDAGEDQGVFTPGLVKHGEFGTFADSTPATANRSATKQYVLVGAVMLAGIALLWFLRQQGVGADLLFADTKIDYNLDQPIDEQAEARQRKVMDDLAIDASAGQVPANEIEQNPFRLAQMTQLEPEVPLIQAQPEQVPTGPTPEEMRLAELDRLAAELYLNTVIAGRISLARINSQTYRVGDVVAGEFTVMEITADRTVVLEADGYEYVLEMSSR
ncbi:MAG: hypothetical protein AAGB48_06680 [Planctomycetota bacterium]